MLIVQQQNIEAEAEASAAVIAQEKANGIN